MGVIRPSHGSRVPPPVSFECRMWCMDETAAVFVQMTLVRCQLSVTVRMLLLSSASYVTESQTVHWLCQLRCSVIRVLALQNMPTFIILAQVCTCLVLEWTINQHCTKICISPDFSLCCVVNNTRTQCNCAECTNGFGNDTACDAWAQAGECETNPGWMVAYCRKSCWNCQYAGISPSVYLLYIIHSTWVSVYSNAHLNPDLCGEMGQCLCFRIML